LQAAWLGAVVAGSLGFAMAMRYLAIESAPVTLACEAGDPGWVCLCRRVLLAGTHVTAFGGVAIGAALLNLLRPSIVLASLGAVGAAFGLVLYNTPSSAIAVTLLALSLARPVPERE